eukprot:scaffold136235_cov259-Phaeocystis_antarctica.AAC.2
MPDATRGREVGEVVARWANLNALRGNSVTNEDTRASNGLQRSAVCTALYSSGNTEPLDLGSCRLRQVSWF